MPLTIELPEQYGLILAVVSSTAFVSIYHSSLTGGRRKISGVAYPASYATDEQIEKNPAAYYFNCAQRAHANFIENYISFVPALMISGLRFPVASAALGGIWVLGRVLYAAGYTSSGPKGRRTGFYISVLADLVLRIGAMYTSVTYALGN